MTKTLPKLEDRLSITVNGETKELFMSAGMIRELAKLIGQYDEFSVVYLDAQVQEQCILSLFVERNEYGKPISNISDMSLMAFDISIADADKLTKWIGDHIVNFFIGGAMNMKQSVEIQEEIYKNLAESLTGIENSIQQKQSAGPLK